MEYVDVLVIGGGVAGCAAAVSSSRSGAKTLLAEKYGFLGGTASAGLVSPFMSHKTSDGKELIRGFFAEITRSLADMNASLANAFDPEALKYILQQKVISSGASLLLHVFFLGACYNNDGSIKVTLRGQNGTYTISAKRVVDCSGDASVARALGAQTDSCDEFQSLTLMFDVGGIDLEKAFSYVRTCPNNFLFPKMKADDDIEAASDNIYSVAGYYDEVAEAKAADEYHVPGDMIFYIARPRKGEAVFNTTHVGGIDPSNAFELTRAEIEARQQIYDVMALLKKRISGFENCFLLRTADEIGVREAARIIGDYIFCEDDIARGRKFDDCVCRLAYPVDVHTKSGYTRKEQEQFGHAAPPEGDWYEIPYRSLIPKGLENVIVAGKCVSATHCAHGAVRIMPACIAMGEAAGYAAAYSAKSGCMFRDVPIKDILAK